MLLDEKIEALEKSRALAMTDLMASDAIGDTERCRKLESMLDDIDKSLNTLKVLRWGHL